MKKIIRDYKALCRTEGFELLGVETDRRHCRLNFAAGFVVAPSTPSDQRNLKHVRSAIRRLHA
ncbi:hypothetical protein GQE99_15055 [Maritimibacter sp. DP07]|uniref:Uncharacterized protein n=1 Tax=Maritimibacter harenae TaxID=2606218 RepID=A0A845M449_9RHOB|nr:hypothetical protein [Maritimibacter harenae]MZR14336.1 hypothetical protein [Maritimibacter harenae]